MPETIINLSRENLRLVRAEVVFGDVEYGPGGTCGPRRQQDYQLVILHEGTMEAEIEGVPIFVDAGQALLLHPRHRECLLFTPDGRTRHSWCAVRPAAVPARVKQALGKARAPFAWTPHLQKIFDLGSECGAFSMPEAHIEAPRFLSLGLLLLIESLVEMRRQDKVGMDRRVERMQQFIVREYRQPLDLSALARSAGVSKQHLGKICRRLGQPAPLLQLYQQRLASATDLLLHTGLSIKEISEQCGFQNPYHFSRKFKEWSRFCPRVYRQRIQRESIHAVK